jgi:hypothetical protein
MRKIQNEPPSTAKVRQVAARSRASSTILTARALMEGRHDAVDPDGLMNLQRMAGNRAVSRMIDEAPVVARWGMPAIAPAAPAVSTTEHKVDDDEDTLYGLTPMGMIPIYIATEQQYVDGKFEAPHTNASFTYKFIRDRWGTMLKVIAEKMEAKHDRAGVYREILRSMPGDPGRIGEVRQLLTHEYQQDVKGLNLNETEGLELTMKTREVILESMGEFGYQCQNQKSAIRKELAEDSELFSFILEIAFSFVPVAGKALGKGVGKLALKHETLKKIEHGLEIAEAAGAKEAVEGTLKGAQRAIKSSYSSNQSEGEEFIDRLQKEFRKAGEGILDGVDRMTYGQMLHTAAEFAEKMDTYGEEIASRYEMYKKSAGHIGETRAWEYGTYRATVGRDTQAAKIQTTKGQRIALITYEGMMGTPHGQPVWVDWVPDEMEAATVEKSKKQFGEPIELAWGRYTVPDEYSSRFRKGYGLPL